MADFFLVSFFLVADLVLITFFLVSLGVTSVSTAAGSGVTSVSTAAGSGVTSVSTAAGSSSTCSEKNAELSSDNGFVSTIGFGFVSANTGFSSCCDSTRLGNLPKLSDITLLLSILM